MAQRNRLSPGRHQRSAPRAQVRRVPFPLRVGARLYLRRLRQFAWPARRPISGQRHLLRAEFQRFCGSLSGPAGGDKPRAATSLLPNYARARVAGIRLFGQMAQRTAHMAAHVENQAGAETLIAGVTTNPATSAVSASQLLWRWRRKLIGLLLSAGGLGGVLNLLRPVPRRHAN